MASVDHSLNLARLLRPRHFNQVIGQDLSVRMLQNSLYLKKFFPLYIFSGQRGCGKTTLARIFAAAVNCNQLQAFRENPKNAHVPCLECPSCKAVSMFNHPDFIEIDAASHTGVDNVRQILESASYLPVSGTMKVYLIDEAHMLSKAAFNAFLKMLEEPPTSVLFMLATTELHKIPDTVRSRAFHLFFEPIGQAILTSYLKELCEREKIEAHHEALMLIARYSQGSVRDSLTMLDQARLAFPLLDQQAINSLLGKIDDRVTLTIFHCLAKHDISGLIEVLSGISHDVMAASRLWESLLELCRVLTLLKHNVHNALSSYGDQDRALLAQLQETLSLETITTLYRTLWDNEEIFLKTQHKTAFLESLLITFCNNTAPKKDQQQQSRGGNHGGTLHATNPSGVNSAPKEQKKEEILHKNEVLEVSGEAIAQPQDTWSLFINALSVKNDPLLISIIKQTSFVRADYESKALVVVLGLQSAFFLSKLSSSKETIAECLMQSYPGLERLEIVAPLVSKDPQEQKDSINELISFNKSSVPTGPKKTPSPTFEHTMAPRGNHQIDLSDAARWPKATLLATHFSGKIEKVE